MGSKICDPGEHLKYLGMFFSPTETPSLARLAVLRLLSTWLALRLLGWKQDDHLRCCGCGIYMYVPSESTRAFWEIPYQWSFYKGKLI